MKRDSGRGASTVGNDTQRELSDNGLTRSPGTPSVARTAAILYHLSDSEAGVSVRSVAERTGASRSAVHRALQTFAHEGFAVQDSDGRYSPGPRLLQLAARALARSSIVSVADPIMTQLMKETGETTYLAMLVRSESYATFVHRVECNNPLRYVIPLGAQIPLHAGAAGKAILAARQTDLGELSLPYYTENTITDLADLRAHLDDIADQGFATSQEERVEGAAGVAAPIFSGDHVIGSVTITVPVTRLPEAGLESLGPVVRRHAKEISSLMPTTRDSSL